MEEKILIFLVAETGAGKDTVANKLPYPKVVSYKTGPMRNSDIQGVTHHFISDDEMDEMERSDKIIAWAHTGNIRYCATEDQLTDDIMIYIINPDGIRWFKEYYNRDNFHPIIGI
jgi:guanylate kinase